MPTGNLYFTNILINVYNKCHLSSATAVQIKVKDIEMLRYLV